MTNLPKITITVRGLIIHQNKLLMCKHPVSQFYCLPGGKLEPGETIEAGMERELLEETGIKPLVGPLLFINQFINDEVHRVEFFFLINNSADYANFDPTKATHGYEIEEFILADPSDYDLKPDFLRHQIANIVTHGPELTLQIIHSS